MLHCRQHRAADGVAVLRKFGPFRLRADTLLLTRAGEPVALGPKVVETLLALIERPGEVMTKAALVERIWPEGFVEEANLAQNIHVLRKTFRHHRFADPIETIPCRGYRFTAPVRLVHGAAAAPAVVSPRRSVWGRVAAMAAGGAFVAASLVGVASYGLGHRSPPAPVLADRRTQLYQIGRYYWNLRTREGVRKSLDYFTRLIDSDPQDARGWAAMADANVAMADYCYGTHRPSVYFARAREYANKALALNPNSAEAHATLGFIALDRGDSTAAVAELQRALALDPSYASAHAWFGIALLDRGHRGDGLRQLKIAADLDPLAVTTTAWIGSLAYAKGRYSDAIAYARQALELTPQRPDALVILGQAYAAQGDLDRAIATFKRYGALGPYYRPEAAALLARVYALRNRMTEARAEFAFARAHSEDLNITDLTDAASGLGDRSGAALLLRRVHGHRIGTENAVRAWVT